MTENWKAAFWSEVVLGKKIPCALTLCFVACAGHSLPPFQLGATPGSHSQTDHRRSALIWGSSVVTDSPADSTVPLGVAAGDTQDQPDSRPHAWPHVLALSPLAQSRGWRDFPGGPVAKTLSSGPGFDLWSGN